MAAAWALLALAPSAPAAIVIQFDPTGNAGATTNLPVAFFAWSPGNTLAQGVIDPVTHQLIAGTPFTVLYQAKLDTLQDTAGDPVYAPGLVGTQFTAVAKFNESATSTGPTSASFTTDVGQAGSFFEIYYNGSKTASNYAGTGFTDGTLIYRAAISSTAGLGGSYSVTSFVPGTPLDQSAAPQPSPDTVTGAGGSSLLTLTPTFIDSNFFLSSMSSVVLFFDTSNITPFNKINPSQLFYDGSGSVAPQIGGLNGFSGPDFQFQSTANASFFLQAVPEPSTVTVALVGLVVVAGARLRRPRRAS